MPNVADVNYERSLSYKNESISVVPPVTQLVAATLSSKIAKNCFHSQHSYQPSPRYKINSSIVKSRDNKAEIGTFTETVGKTWLCPT